eukprot:COSAG02_NODE_8459_length_2564_cov_2.330495_2_plen_183_part_00
MCVCCIEVGLHDSRNAVAHDGPVAFRLIGVPPPQPDGANICHTHPPASTTARIASAVVLRQPTLISRTSCLLKPMSSRQWISISLGPVLESDRLMSFWSRGGKPSGPLCQLSPDSAHQSSKYMPVTFSFPIPWTPITCSCTRNLRRLALRWSHKYSPHGAFAPQSHLVWHSLCPVKCCGVWS